MDAALGNFVNKLISETVDSVISAQLEQEFKHLELREDLELSSETFIAKYNLYEEARASLGEAADEATIQKCVEDYYEKHKTVLEKYLANGAVKLVVDRGKVSAKMILSTQVAKKTEILVPKKNKGKGVENIEKSKISKKRKTAGLTIGEIRGFESKMTKLVLGKKQLAAGPLALDGIINVRPVDAKDKRANADLVSTIEFEFRTVIE